MSLILDCTLRDGGYYTNWDFHQDLVDNYLETISLLPVDYIEIGYRSPSKESYLGEYFYLPINTIRNIRSNIRFDQKLSIMINTKDIKSKSQLFELLEDIKGLVDLVRFASAPESLKYSVELALQVKEMGFEVALNIMYLSKLTFADLDNLLMIKELSNIDYLYFVDSYGACLPDEVSSKVNYFKSRNPKVNIGFHGHDNLELAFANSLEAVKSGTVILDSTITGMGRGAGNLKTEVISLHKSKRQGLFIDYESLVNLVNKFNDMKSSYGWGTSLPYMIAGFNGLPQDKVMSLVSKQRYSTTSIIENLVVNNQEHNNVPDTIKKVKNSKFSNDNVLIIGGGNEVNNHLNSIIEFAQQNDALIINSSIKNAELFSNLGLKHFVCLPGDERNKLSIFQGNLNNIDGIILSENTAKIVKTEGISLDIFYVENETMLTSSYNEIDEDAPLALGLSLALQTNAENVYLAGFDGYKGINEKERLLKGENQEILDNYKSNNMGKLYSLTPTLYNINRFSLYSYLANKDHDILV